jgi:capsular exopolysaccharide synthesis family protein
LPMDLDLRGYAGVVWKRRWLALAGFLVVVIAAVLYTISETPVYQANVTLFVGQQQIAVQNLTQGLAVTDLSARLLKSYGEILTSRTIAQRAVLDGSLNVTPGEVRGGLNVQPVVDTQVLKLAYNSNEPATAARVANAVADAFVRQISQIDTPQGSKSSAVTVSIVDRAVSPFAPISPNPARNVTLGVLLGLLLGIGLAVGFEYIDTSVKSREDAEQLGLPVVGVIPRLDTRGADVYLDRDPQDAGSEAFRKLRTAIGYLGVEKPIQTLLVTSSMAQEGKTTIALNLAAAYAQSGYSTVLVEADLRRPSLHRIFGVSGTDGLTTVIIGDANLTSSLRVGEIAGLQCLVAGAIPPNPVELLESEQMRDVLSRLRSQFDMVVVDSPPVMPVADSLALATMCDGVVAVARAGKTNRDRLVEAIKQIERSNGHFIGVIMNCLRAGDASYEYGYYNAYRSARPADRPAASRRDG